MLSKGYSVVIESAFELSFAKPIIQSYIDKYNADVFEIYCFTQKKIRRQRFEARNKSGERHIGHNDHVNYLSNDEDEPIEKYSAIGLGKQIRLDTTLTQINVDSLIKEIK